MSAWRGPRWSQGSGRPEATEEGGRQVFSIAQLYDGVDDALNRRFPRSRLVWVRGEVHQLSDRTGHCYLDLVDPEGSRGAQPPILKVKCWRSTWAPLKRALAREGVALEPGMAVVLRGSLDFYRPKAELGFILAEVDVAALLGRLAARRRALIEALRTEGLLEANRRRPVPEVPRRLALVASPGTEGYRDFLGQLEGSTWAFEVQVARAVVQGHGAPTSLARALRRASASGADLVVVVRGGGSRADLAAFDAEVVARAVATSPVPVWTGIGHSGDQAVADLVANRSLITPTECGREVVARMAAWWEAEVADPARAISEGAAASLRQEEVDLTTARRHLAGVARHQVRWHRQHVGERARALAHHGRRVADAEAARLAGHRTRLPDLARHHLARCEEGLDLRRRLVAAYDVERQLERGYSLTLDEEGRILRRAADVVAGQRLVTRLAQGQVHSVVEQVAPGEGRKR